MLLTRGATQRYHLDPVGALQVTAFGLKPKVRVTYTHPESRNGSTVKHGCVNSGFETFSTSTSFKTAKHKRLDVVLFF